MSATEANLLVGEYGERVSRAHQPELAADYLTPNVKWHGATLGPPRLS
jgi:hypothetical protein